MRTYDYTSRAAFTLLELLAAVVVMSIIAAVIAPVVATASESYTVTREVRSSTERVAYALDRVTRMVRQAPIGEDDSGVGVATATSTTLIFTDGSGLALDGDTLEMVLPTGETAPLCTEVESFEIRYLDRDGTTDVMATPERTHRFSITIRSGGAELSVLVHPRVWIGQEDA